MCVLSAPRAAAGWCSGQHAGACARRQGFESPTCQLLFREAPAGYNPFSQWGRTSPRRGRLQLATTLCHRGSTAAATRCTRRARCSRCWSLSRSGGRGSTMTAQTAGAAAESMCPQTSPWPRRPVSRPPARSYRWVGVFIGTIRYGTHPAFCARKRWPNSQLKYGTLSSMDTQHTRSHAARIRPLSRSPARAAPRGPPGIVSESRKWRPGHCDRAPSVGRPSNRGPGGPRASPRRSDGRHPIVSESAYPFHPGTTRMESVPHLLLLCATGPERRGPVLGGEWGGGGGAARPG